MKLPNVQLYPINDIPDHIIEEIRNLYMEMNKLLDPLFENHNPNIILGALNFTIAACIKHYVSDDREQQAKAAKFSALAILKNVELLNGQKLFDEEF